MKGDQLPGKDHVLRYVKPTLIDGDRLDGSAFLARSGEDGVSTNWWEILAPPNQQRLEFIRSVARLNYSKNGCLALLSVGQSLVAFIEQHISELSFVHDPLEAEPNHANARFRMADETHALILGVPNSDDPESEKAGDILARLVTDKFPAVEQ